MPMRRLAMPMHSLRMLMCSPALKTLRFYAKLYLEDDFAQIQFEQIDHAVGAQGLAPLRQMWFKKMKPTVIIGQESDRIIYQ